MYGLSRQQSELNRMIEKNNLGERLNQYLFMQSQISLMHNMKIPVSKMVLYNQSQNERVMFTE